MRIKNKNLSKNNRNQEEKKDKEYQTVTSHKMNLITAAGNLICFQQAEKHFQSSILQDHKEISLNKWVGSNNKSKLKN